MEEEELFYPAVSAIGCRPSDYSLIDFLLDNYSITVYSSVYLTKKINDKRNLIAQ